MKFASLIAETIVNVLFDTILNEDANISYYNHSEEPPLYL